MGGVEEAAQRIAGGHEPAARRLRELLTSIHRMNCERYVGDSKLHEMVAIAMEQSWDVCKAHMERITGTIGEVIAEGAAKGEFHAPDVAAGGDVRLQRHDAVLSPANDRPVCRQAGTDAGPDDRFRPGRPCSARRDGRDQIIATRAIRDDIGVNDPGLKDLHYYEPVNGHGLRHDPFNAIIAPRPIGWISSRDAKGHVNLAPYSFFNGFNYHPPIIGFSSTSWKDSVANIQETGEFVWNLATMDLAQQMNATAAHVAHEVDEFTIAGLTAAPGKLVKVPRVAESPVSFECKLTQIIQLQGADGRKVQGWLTLGEVVAVHIDKKLIKDGVYQTALARPIVRAGRRGDYFEIRPDALFEMVRPD